MKLFAAFLSAALLSQAFLSQAWAAAAPSIGMVTASGQFHLDGSRIWGNSTLFDGARIETSDASSELALSNGVKIHLAAGSSARIWKSRMELERGTGQVIGSPAFRVNAGEFAVEGARYRVGYRSGAGLEVAALTGDARVLGSRGNLLASVPVGKNMSFAMQQIVTRTGCLVYKNNGFLLQVDDSPEVLQLTGGPLAQNVGNRVSVTGALGTNAPTISPATLILNVTGLLMRAGGGCLTVATALGAQTSVTTTPAPAPTGSTPSPGVTPERAPASVARTGMSAGAKVAIIGAVAGGGAGAALAMGGKKSSTSQ